MISLAGLLLVAGLLLTFFSLARLQYSSDRLWQIVSQQCQPGQERYHDPGPCLAVSLDQGYAIFNDARGPLHTLLIPTDRIPGIESEALLQNRAKNYFDYSWNQRHLLTQRAPFPVADGYLAQAINSRFGRTQNQLHIHLACLKPEVYSSLMQHLPDDRWQPIAIPLNGRRYMGIRVSATADPFAQLARYVRADHDAMANFGLLRVMLNAHEAVLLTTRVDLMRLSVGNTESLLDTHCQLARQALKRDRATAAEAHPE